jgi:hypothetical protein
LARTSLIKGRLLATVQVNLAAVTTLVCGAQRTDFSSRFRTAVASLPNWNADLAQTG